MGIRVGIWHFGVLAFWHLALGMWHWAFVHLAFGIWNLAFETEQSYCIHSVFARTDLHKASRLEGAVWRFPTVQRAAIERSLGHSSKQLAARRFER